MTLIISNEMGGANRTMWKTLEIWSGQSARVINAMKKRKLNHRKSRQQKQAKADWHTLEPKGTESDYNGCVYVIGNGHMVPGL